MKIVDILPEAKIPTKINPETGTREFDQTVIDQLHQAMRQVKEFSDSWMDVDLNDSYQTVMKYLPDARYTGDMYRGIKLDFEKIKQAGPRDVLKIVKQKIQLYSRKIMSWSTDLDITFDFIQGPVGVILYQRTQGLDVNNLYHEEFDFDASSAFESEAEIMAPMSSRVKIHGFVVKDSEDEPTFFPSADFNKFMAFKQSNI